MNFPPSCSQINLVFSFLTLIIYTLTLTVPTPWPTGCVSVSTGSDTPTRWRGSTGVTAYGDRVGDLVVTLLVLGLGYGAQLYMVETVPAERCLCVPLIQSWFNLANAWSKKQSAVWVVKLNSTVGETLHKVTKPFPEVAAEKSITC